MEQQIKLAARIYQVRDTAKKFHGEKYQKVMAIYGAIIRTYMAKNGVGELETVIALAKEWKDQDTEGLAIMNLTAAAAELLEPSKQTPSI